jgi:serine/threonine-protein kinase RsbT
MTLLSRSNKYWMMAKIETKCRQIEIKTEREVWLAISTGASIARELGLTEADRVRIETVISEMAHNVLVHGGGGAITIEAIAEDNRHGLRVCARDVGPGMADVSQALRDGFSTQDSLGIGLGVTKRMMDDVSIRSHPGWGTVVTVTKWLSNGRDSRPRQESSVGTREQ